MFTPESKVVAPTAQTEFQSSGKGYHGVDWRGRAEAAYQSSTSFMDTNYRKAWEDSIKACHSQFPSDSKYTQPAYEKRSRLFRPKTRTIIRKNEAAAAAAFFSNMDTVSVAAEDQSNKVQLANAELMKGILQYRLSKSIPWFLTVLGGLQDAQNMGVVCAHVYWDYKEGEQESEVNLQGETEENPEEYPKQDDLPTGAFTMDASNPESKKVKGQGKPLSDKPCIDLIPIENIRIDPAAKWTDPVHSSPYFIHLMPMHAMDVKAKMESGKWMDLGEGALSKATNIQDSTRSARQKDRDDPLESASRTIDDYEIVWVQRHIHRHEGEEIEFYVLTNGGLLTEPAPLKESVLHGKRPYEIGCCILEAHRIMPSSVYQVGKGLQDEANEVVNQRLDNVKFALNKKWFIKRGRDVDVAGLMRNVPGGGVMMDDPEKDVREISWPDVTQSAYEEQNRINLDMDELLGNFNPAGLMAQSAHQNSPARNMSMLNQSTGTMVEYLIRTYVETFIQPVLRQLVLLEQHYETDAVVVGIAAKSANLFQRFGINEVTDEMLKQELTINVNVGMGATDPSTKLQKFLSAMNSYSAMAQHPPPGVNLQEVGKEIFGHLGYSDGSRFFTQDNPQVLALQQQLQQMGAQMADLQKKLLDKTNQHIAGVMKTKITNETKKSIADTHEIHEDRRNLATHLTSVLNASKKANNGR